MRQLHARRGERTQDPVRRVDADAPAGGTHRQTAVCARGTSVPADRARGTPAALRAQAGSAQ
ncbi:UNVERIFIED_CONTAM: hypothetical protein GTU68_040634 [Idotea baltica]|nr:hypothetical protein [Idotea baltica]